MKTTPIVLLAVLLTGLLPLYSQPDFRQGYIITLEEDTIYGEIDYRGALDMGSFCKFRELDSDSVKLFKPTDIHSFRFLGSKYYVSREYEGKTYFFEYLIKGMINIYFLRSEHGDNYYFDKDSVQFRMIPYEEGIKYRENTRYFFQTTDHMNMLRYYMQDDPDIESKVTKVKKPAHKNLIKMARQYHYSVCEEGDECIIYEKQSPIIVHGELFYGSGKFYESDYRFRSFGGNIYFLSSKNEKFSFKTGLFRHTGITQDVYGFGIPVQLQYMASIRWFEPRMALGVNIYRKGLTGFYGEYRYAPSLNAGFNVRIYKSLRLSANSNFEFSPKVFTFVQAKFKPLSYLLNVGLYFKKEN
ncbi:MAG: hypothetical protein KDD63_18780 [Bacteroidetes bacterium]|nr:hypothetical protein [Bacteroidota bacterium]MCB0854279.1 hypothetical protein [Bacteroidota bacterium]